MKIIKFKLKLAWQFDNMINLINILRYWHILKNL